MTGHLRPCYADPLSRSHSPALSPFVGGQDGNTSARSSCDTRGLRRPLYGLKGGCACKCQTLPITLSSLARNLGPKSSVTLAAYAKVLLTQVWSQLQDNDRRFFGDDWVLDALNFAPLFRL